MSKIRAFIVGVIILLCIGIFYKIVKVSNDTTPVVIRLIKEKYPKCKIYDNSSYWLVVDTNQNVYDVRYFSDYLDTTNVILNIQISNELK